VSAVTGGRSLITAIESIDGTASYAYDAVGQLTGATYRGLSQFSSDENGTVPLDALPPDESYQWDANGNPDGTGYVIGLDNRLLSDGAYCYAYDAEGNRTARFVDANADGLLDAADSDVTQYIWDARNRLVEVLERASLGDAVSQLVQYFYDVENRWIAETIDADGDSAIDHETRFAYDLVPPSQGADDLGA